MHFTENNDFTRVIRSSVSFSSEVTEGETRCITLNIFDDTRVENDEYFMVRIKNGARTQIEGSNNIRINILDNDGKQNKRYAS